MKKYQPRQIDGILLLDKPIGISSNRALQKIKHLFQAKKAGHTGTLDVLASGMLIVCFGKATKLAGTLLNADKTYQVNAKLGVKTTTCDSEGEILATKPTDNITKEMIEKVLQEFRGEIMQIPSMYSALKHNGTPLYKLARKGIEVKREPRKVNIYELKLLEWSRDSLKLKVRCSKGTYIRNLIDDIGEVLGCGAYVIELRRLSIGKFQAEQMHTIEEIQQEPDRYLLPDDILSSCNK
ncbi:MAG: tRNA pseudouridine(55) synthase TruB [Gammaproteobacteria bacterium]|jgi:tRNA pseudouridine55 synthase